MMKTTEDLRVEIIKYRERIFLVCLGMLQSADSPHDEAHDATSETMIKAARGLEKFQGSCELYSWLHRIALNVSKDRLKRIAKRRQNEAASIDLEVVHGDFDRPVAKRDIIPDECFGDPLSIALTSMSRRMVIEAIEKIGNEYPHHARVLVGRDLQDKSYVDMALESGVGVPTIKTRISRARAALRGHLAKAYRNGEL